MSLLYIARRLIARPSHQLGHIAHAIVDYGGDPIVLNERVALLFVVVRLARVDGPVSKIGIDALQVPQQVRPVVGVAFARVVWRAEFANPYRGDVALD